MALQIKNIAIIGGGALGHVTAGWLANKGYEVSLLTRKPEEWSLRLRINTPDEGFISTLHVVSSYPIEVIPNADVVLLTVPGYANECELRVISPYLKATCYVGAVFCSSGFFFEALKILPENIRLWGFQRVPFISRVEKYGYEANLLGFRSEFNIAVERASLDEKIQFTEWVEEAFGSVTVLRNNYLEVSITNSNPILHTARLYTMFYNWDEDKRSDHNILFYEEWTEEAAELLIKMDEELFKILKFLPVSNDYLMPLLKYYESNDAKSLRDKLSSISGFKGIMSPMKRDSRGWQPDYSNRYFIEDFGYSLRYIWQLGKKYNVYMPNIDKVYMWGKEKINNGCRGSD